MIAVLVLFIIAQMLLNEKPEEADNAPVPEIINENDIEIVLGGKAS